MQNITKPIITVFFAFIAVAMLLTRTNTVMNNWSNDELNYALRIATQDASAVLMDENQIIGTDEEVNEFHLDLDNASKQFKESFAVNIGSTLTENIVNDMSVSLSGYVGYRHIYGKYGNGSTAAAFSYTTYKDGKLYEFTLGDKVFITDTTTGNESATLLSGMPEHFFSPTITNENFQRITVMKSINEYLNLFYSDEQNITAHNTGSGIDFELGLVDYAIDDPSVMNKLSAIIDGPGFFAVVDCFDTTMNQPYRLFSIGGSELKLKQDTL